MLSKATPNIFEDYERDRGDLTGLFSILADAFEIRRALYPGSYVHVTPSFVFPYVTYVDTERRAWTFFADREGIEVLVEQRKRYEGRCKIAFHHADYTTDLDEPDQSFDLLISLYAGFVSQPCKRYLCPGGWL